MYACYAGSVNSATTRHSDAEFLIDPRRGRANNHGVPSVTRPFDPVEPSSVASSSPDWSLVPFEVGCARCGHDLRGLSEPLCPACGLQFDWAEAVPVESLVCRKCKYHLFGLRETRCPECGEPFTWEQALDDYRRSRKPIFEYRWREEPVRSLFRTWRMAFRPRKLWSTIDLHDPPKVIPLLMMVLAAAFALTVSVVIPATAREVPGFLEWFATLWKRGAGAQEYWTVVVDFASYALKASARSSVIAVSCFWWMWSYLGLMVFQQSMHRCRVRPSHVLRVVVFSVVMLSPVACIVISLMWFADRWYYLPPAWRTWFELGMVTLLFLSLVWTGRGLVLAYRYYVKMPHALGVVVASQVIAVLATLVTHLLVFAFG